MSEQGTKFKPDYERNDVKRVSSKDLFARFEKDPESAGTVVAAFVEQAQTLFKQFSHGFEQLINTYPDAVVLTNMSMVSACTMHLMGTKEPECIPMHIMCGLEPEELARKLVKLTDMRANTAKVVKE